MSNTDPRVDAYLENAKNWSAEFERLRRIILAAGLTESLKWAKPCYGFKKSNVAILQPFKAFGALMFFKGTLLKDPKGILAKPGENSRAAGRFEFTSVDDIERLEPTLRAYIAEAIALEKAGAKVDFAGTIEISIPVELEEKFGDDAVLESAFNELTPGLYRTETVKNAIIPNREVSSTHTRWKRVQRTVLIRRSPEWQVSDSSEQNIVVHCDNLKANRNQGCYCSIIPGDGCIRTFPERNDDQWRLPLWCDYLQSQREGQ